MESSRGFGIFLVEPITFCISATEISDSGSMFDSMCNFKVSSSSHSDLPKALIFFLPKTPRYAAVVISDIVSKESFAQVISSATPGFDFGFSTLFFLGSSSFLNKGRPADGSESFIFSVLFGLTSCFYSSGFGGG